MKILNFVCPNCEDIIQVKENEINCGIFRHGIFRSNGQQINPHASQKVCEELINSGKVYGCAKPFRIIDTNGIKTIKKCGYL